MWKFSWFEPVWIIEDLRQRQLSDRLLLHPLPSLPYQPQLPDDDDEDEDDVNSDDDDEDDDDEDAAADDDDDANEDEDDVNEDDDVKTAT